jgi:hypothetical protein
MGLQETIKAKKIKLMSLVHRFHQFGRWIIGCARVVK